MLDINLHYLLMSCAMKTPAEVYVRLQQRLVHEARSMRSKRNQMKKLSFAYNRYVDLDREIDTVRHRISIIVGLLGPDRVAETVKIDSTACLGETLGLLRPPQEARERLTLWRAVREYLRVVGEAKIGDIQEFLDWIGLQDFTRQALESALQNHENEFEVSKKGRERYVSLK